MIKVYTRSARLLVAAAVLLVAATVAGALSTENVYFGSARRYSKPAEVKARRVFMTIPAYREIIDRNIEKDSAIYLMKLEEANKVFREVVAKYAQENDYDLVCEEGRVAGAHNATDEVIAAIRGKSSR